MVLTINIDSLDLYIHHIKEHRQQWGEKAIAWFRGEPEISTRLLPKVFRKRIGGGTHNENALLQMFRMKAPTFSQSAVPPRENTDQWLFLAQHVGLPTRLLDWTESALLGLYFALNPAGGLPKKKSPVVWMLDPIGLNGLSIDTVGNADFKTLDVFPLTWFRPKDGRINIGVENIAGAWEINYDGIRLPVAVIPTYMHPRMSAQRSVFTIHGRVKKSLDKMIPEYLLRKFVIQNEMTTTILKDLHLLGIHHSTAFPDLDGLAKELADIY